MTPASKKIYYMIGLTAKVFTAGTRFGGISDHSFTLFTISIFLGVLSVKYQMVA